MYLKELELFGFKSFPEKTVLRFEPGITVIVGPNGCGKSNILDALKWALGEQSPKSLRGSKMEDVIFGGTENYPSLNYAEVSLTFCNEAHYLALDYKEVCISRRLYRSGESEYYINRNPVRLKDITDLFLGTGVGEATYSFVEQGKIELFLSYKPEEKRLIFDEASGIVKYKERKKEALRRLEETEENLLRLEDIINEVNRQSRYLERQVEKVNRYKELQQELISIEKSIANLESSRLQQKTDQLLEELNRLKGEEEQKTKELGDLKKNWEELNTYFEKIRQELETTSENIINSHAEAQTIQNSLSFLNQNQVDLVQRSSTFGERKSQLNARLKIQQGRISEEREKFKAIEEDMERIEGELKSALLERGRLEEEDRHYLKEIEAQKLKILELEERGVRMRNHLIELETNLSSLSNRKKRLLLDKATLQGLKEKTQRDFETKEKEFTLLEEGLGLRIRQKNELAQRQEEVFAQQELFRTGLLEKEKEQIEVRSYYEFLKELHIKYETFSVRKKIVILFEEEPKGINKLVASLTGIGFRQEGNFYRVELEAKVISLEESQLEERLKATEQEIVQIKKSLEDLEKEKAILKGQIFEQDSYIEEKEREKQRLLKEKEHLEKELLRIKDEFLILEDELGGVLAEINELEKRQNALKEELESTTNELSLVQQNISVLEKRIDTNNQRLKEIDLEKVKKETQKQALNKERESLSSKISLLEEERENILRGIKQLEEEEKENFLKIDQIEKTKKELGKKLGELKEKIKTQIESKKELEEERQQCEEKIAGQKNILGELEKACSDLKNSVYNKRLEIQSLEYEKEKIKDYLRQVYRIEFVYEEPQEALEKIPQYLETREALKKKLENLGEVNLVALEEFNELKRRQEFLNQQKNDLINSKENLKKAIQKINKTCRELFIETFTKVEEEFKKNFRFLFGGGRAQIILLDPENILESGVEIEVQPPGKKLQNVSLLSGGEKALTTIALIFAIFKVRPSPLCVLDEIDAPLDEANVDRFNHLLKQFACTSQFLLITHNKKTMNSANILYGVTMQEKGVSKLVSVKFAEEKEPPLPQQFPSLSQQKLKLEEQAPEST